MAISQRKPTIWLSIVPSSGANYHRALSTKIPACTKAKCHQGLAPSGSAKIVSCNTSPRACAPSGAVNLASPEATQKALFKARKQKLVTPTTQGVGSKPKGVLGRLGPLNSNHILDLREYLSSKRKLRSNEITDISPS